MSFEPVDIIVTDTLDLAVEGVMVKIYNPAGDTLFTQGTTDGTGKASFLLETLKYQVRFYKFHTRFWQPVTLEVLAAPAANVFDIDAEVFTPPAAEDPRLCLCSGYFRNLDGSPMRYLDIHLIAQFEPVLLDDAAVIGGGELHIRTDKDGYTQTCLIRGANYTARIESQPGQDSRCIRVPDVASANLPDLLFPVVARIEYDIAFDPFTLVAGATLTVTPTVYDSGGVPLVGTANQDLNWRSSAPNIMSVQVKETTIDIVGIAPGTAQIIAERNNLTIIKIPSGPIEGSPQDVVVT